MWWRHRNRQIGALIAVMLLIGSLAPLVRANAPGNAFFERTWERTDKPVADGVIPRTWMWGPFGNTGGMPEPYAESPGMVRVVQYYDKARMEITYPNAVDDGVWFVTNGLLVVEMVTQQIQVGDALFEPHKPADIPVAGDSDDPDGPTYQTFAGLMAPVGNRGNAVIAETVNRAGQVGSDQSYAAQGITTAYWDEVTGHNIAKPFWDFMNSNGIVYQNGAYVEDKLFINPFYATGRPIAEPFWAQVKVANTVKAVLMQCFERRCLTYTPDNSPGWQVEAGNVGQHYYCWRYCVDGELPTPVPTNTPPSGGGDTGNLTPTVPGGGNGTATSTPNGGGNGTATSTPDGGGNGTATSTPDGGGNGTATATPDGGGNGTATATSTGTVTATSTSTGPNPTNPDIEVQQLGIVVGGNIQIPDTLAGGVAATIGARIYNHSNVPELVNVTTTYQCPLQAPVTINQGQVTIPANSSIVYQFNWVPPGLGLLCTVQVTATTVRTPVDSDSGSWLVLLSIGAGGGDPTPTAVTPTNPNIDVQAFGVVVAGVNIEALSSLTAGVAVPIGARIYNFSNVPEQVNVVTTYQCPLQSPVTINQGQITIPANSSAIYQFNWTPPGLGLLCTVQVTATTVRTPVSVDSESWLVLLSVGIGGGDPTPTSVTPTAPNIDVQAFGLVVGVDITALGTLNLGATVPIGTRIYNFSNVPEEVQVTLDYRFSLLGLVYGSWNTINVGTIVVPANSSVVYQHSWNPPSTLGTYQMRASVSTIRTPVSSDTATWTALLVNP